MSVLAIDIGVGFGPTPIVMLVTVFLLVAIVGGIFLLVSQVLGGLVDKRWPADETLTPAELLWAEVGGHVQKTFPGLDPQIATDLSPFVAERTYVTGDTIAEVGMPAVAYYLITKGEVLVQSDPPQTLGPGDSIGGDDILRRRARSHTVVAASDATLMSLPADDYIAGLALGADVDDDEYVDHALRQLVGATRLPAPESASPMDLTPPAPAAQPAAAPPPLAPPPAAAPPPATPTGWADATHIVGPADLPGYPLPEGETATITLPAGSLILWVEGLPGWAHVRTDGGWQGWVRTDGITPR